MMVEKNTFQASARITFASFPLTQESLMAKLIFKRWRNKEFFLMGGTSKNLW